MTVLNTSYSYVNITKYTADSADNSPNILHPECSIIQYAKQKENIYAFRVCYRDRASLNEEIKGKNRLQLIPYADAIKDLNFIIRNIYNNKKYTADEKRDLIDAHYLVMIKTAQRALENMNKSIESNE